MEQFIAFAAFAEHHKNIAFRDDADIAVQSVGGRQKNALEPVEVMVMAIFSATRPLLPIPENIIMPWQAFNTWTNFSNA